MDRRHLPRDSIRVSLRGLLQSQASPLQVRDIASNGIGAEAVDVDGVLGSQHLAGADVVHGAALRAREIGVVAGAVGVGDLLDGRGAVLLRLDGLEGGCAELERLPQLLL